MKILTDRSIYRPGQTIYIKGIAYAQEGDTAKVFPNETYTVELSDVNGNDIGEKKVRTNEFGSFTTEFILPAACLNGSYTIELRKLMAGHLYKWKNISVLHSI